MSQNKDILTGVVLMTYGSATVAENVPAYFKSIYGERMSQETLEDFENRYRLVGHSPLVEITEKQAALVEKNLGKNFVVRAGMRHSEPSIEKAVAECTAAGAKKIVGVILSPQFSSFIMEGYKTAFTAAAQQYNFSEKDAVVATPWPTEEHFIALLAQRVKEARASLAAQYGNAVPVVFTTHSLPQRVVEKDPEYLTQLRATIDAAVKKIDDPTLVWSTAYQSAGHTPEAWLKPDLTDVLAQLARQGERAVLIAPIQFLADHLEVLFDLDIAAKEQCVERGIAYHRIELPNTDSIFIEALASIARATALL